MNLPHYTPAELESAFSFEAPDHDVESVACYSMDPDGCVPQLDEEVVLDVHYTLGPDGLTVLDVTDEEGVVVDEAALDVLADYYPDLEARLTQVCLDQAALTA